MRTTLYIDASGYLFCPECVRLFNTDPHYSTMCAEPLTKVQDGDCPGEESCDHCRAEAIAFSDFRKIGA